GGGGLPQGPRTPARLRRGPLQPGLPSPQPGTIHGRPRLVQTRTRTRLAESRLVSSFCPLGTRNRAAGQTGRPTPRPPETGGQVGRRGGTTPAGPALPLPAALRHRGPLLQRRLRGPAETGR